MGVLTDRSKLLKIAPIVVIALAGMAARTPLAAAYPRVSVLLFLWIAADSLTLSLIARAPRFRPARRAVFGALAAASIAVAIGSAPLLRDALLTMPVIVGLMLAALAIHIGYGLAFAARAWRSATDKKWVAALSELVPPALVRLAAAELSLLHLALFRWGGPADIPAGSRGFAYHRYLTPMVSVLLALQLIEIAVMHLLVSHWSRTAALVMFVVSDVALIYMIGLLKSFRLKPVLLTTDGVRIRTGILIDRFVPYDAIDRLEMNFTGDDVRDPATLNAGLLAWPNLMLRLRVPLPRHPLLRPRPPIAAIAFRLDDPETFVRMLRWRLGTNASPAN